MLFGIIMLLIIYVVYIWDRNILKKQLIDNKAIIKKLQKKV